MMLYAALFTLAANVWHQTTILLWELALGVPLLLVTSILVLSVRGRGRPFAAVLAVAPFCWALWQADTYLPLLPDFTNPSWPLAGLLPISLFLALFSCLRCWRSLLSPPWVLRQGQPPRRRRALLGLLFAWAVVILFLLVSVLPDELRRPLLDELWGRSPGNTDKGSPRPGSTPEPEPSTPPQSSYDFNPVMPPMNSSPEPEPVPAVSPSRTARSSSSVANHTGGTSPVRSSQPTAGKAQPSPSSSSQATTPTLGGAPIRMVSTAPKPGEVSVIVPILSETPAAQDLPAGITQASVPVSTTKLPRGPARNYPNLARDLAAEPALAGVGFEKTAGRTSLRIGSDPRILTRQQNADGTELLRVQCSTSSADSLGRQASGSVQLDVLMDPQGRILLCRTLEFQDAESALLLGQTGR